MIVTLYDSAITGWYAVGRLHSIRCRRGERLGEIILGIGRGELSQVEGIYQGGCERRKQSPN